MEAVQEATLTRDREATTKDREVTTNDREPTTKDREVAQREMRPTESSGRMRAEAPAIAPLVDIFENAHGITLQAELPGVRKDRLTVRVDRDTLLIEGDVVIDIPEGMEALYADVRVTKYRRSFVLSSELETERTEATLKDGVLTLHIPKRAEFRPRRIEVQAA